MLKILFAVCLAATAWAGESDSQKPAEPLKVDAAHMTPGTSKFLMYHGEDEVGSMTVTWSREGSTYVIHEHTVVPKMEIEEDIHCELDGASFAMKSVTAKGPFAGHDVDVAIAWKGDTITGYTDFPRKSNNGKLVVDRKLDPGTFERTSLFFLVQGLPLEEGFEAPIKVYSTFDDHVRDVTYKVTGTEEVTVPAGTFETYRLELLGGEPSQALFVTTDSPHKLVRLVVLESPWHYKLAP